MKKYLFIVMFLLSVSVFAQDLSEGLQAKNNGNEAFRNKNYVEAINQWEKYLNSGEEGVADDMNTKSLYTSSFKYAASEFLKQKNYESALSYLEKYLAKGGEEAANDGSTAFNMALAANKMNKNDVAMSYFQKSIELKYKEDICVLYIADMYKDAGKEDKMQEILVDAIEKYPDSKNLPKMLKMLTAPMLNKASVPFNEANELAKVASTSKPEDYLKNMELAVEKFSQAIPLFEDVLKYDGSNEIANSYLKTCKDNIQSFNDYKANIKK
jgi:tetratricopeptide (TPR) repeat protein